MNPFNPTRDPVCADQLALHTLFKTGLASKGVYECLHSCGCQKYLFRVCRRNRKPRTWALPPLTKLNLKLSRLLKMRATRMLLGLLVIVGVFVMLAQRSTGETLFLLWSFDVFGRSRVLTLLPCARPVGLLAAANPSRGFNDNIEWRNDLDIGKSFC